MPDQSAVEQLAEVVPLPDSVKRWLERRQAHEQEAEELHMGPYPKDLDYHAMMALAAVALEQAREARSWQRSSENWAKQRDAEKARREQAETEVERLDFLANHASDLLKLAWEDTESAHMKGGWSFSEWLDYLEADLARRSGGES